MTTYMNLSEKVSASSEAIVTYTPAVNTTINIIIFKGEAAFNNKSLVKLAWKYGTPSEKIIWSISGSSEMPFKYVLPQGEIDGVNQLALILENSNTFAVQLSGYAALKADLNV